MPTFLTSNRRISSLITSVALVTTLLSSGAMISTAQATSSQSICFDNNNGIDSYIDADSAGIAVGTGDYTFESWVKISAYDISHSDPRNNHTGGGAVSLMSTDGAEYGTQTHGMTVVVDGLPGAGNGYVGGNIGTTRSGGIPSNAWFHVAFVRVSGVTTTYLNGTLQNTAADTRDYSSPRLRLASKIDQIFPFGFTGCLAGVGFYNSAKYLQNFTSIYPQAGVTPSGAVVYINPTSANTIGDISNSGSGAAPAVTGSVTLSSNVPAPVAPALTGATTTRSVSGTTLILTASATGVTGSPAPTLTYQWSRNGTPITGSINSRYAVLASDSDSSITVAVTVSNVGGSATASSPAADISAVNMPPAGNRLYAVSCEGSANNGQLGLVDPGSGEITNIGQGTTDIAASPAHHGCAGGATFNSVNRLGYWFNWDSGKSQLFSVVPETGVSTFIGELTTENHGQSPVSSEGHIANAQGIATDSSGNMYILWLDSTSHNWFVGKVDKASAVISDVKALDQSGSTTFTSAWPYYFAFNPVNSKFYAVGYGGSWDLVEIDVSTGVTTSRGATGSADNGFCGGPIDANGIMWSINGNVASVAISDWSISNKVQYTTGVPIWYSEALFLFTPEVVSNSVQQPNENSIVTAAHQEQVAKAKSGIANSIASGNSLSANQLLQADFAGVTANNITSINSEFAKLPEDKKADLKELSKIVFKYATVDKISEHGTLYAGDLVTIGLIPDESKNKSAILVALKKLPTGSVKTFEEIQAVVAAIEKQATDRKAKLAAIKARRGK